MLSCSICGKGSQFGHLVRHNHTGQWMKRATKHQKLFKPNIHNGKVLVDGVAKRVRACASCLSLYKIAYVPKVVAS